MSQQRSQQYLQSSHTHEQQPPAGPHASLLCRHELRGLQDCKPMGLPVRNTRRQTDTQRWDIEEKKKKKEKKNHCLEKLYSFQVQNWDCGCVYQMEAAEKKILIIDCQPVQNIVQVSCYLQSKVLSTCSFLLLLFLLMFSCKQFDQLLYSFLMSHFLPRGLLRIQHHHPTPSSAKFMRQGIKSAGATIQRSNQPFSKVRQPQMSPSTEFSSVNKPNMLVAGRKRNNLLGSEHEIKQRGSFLLLVTGALEIETVEGKDNEQCCVNGGTLI